MHRRAGVLVLALGLVMSGCGGDDDEKSEGAVAPPQTGTGSSVGATATPSAPPGTAAPASPPPTEAGTAPPTTPAPATTGLPVPPKKPTPVGIPANGVLVTGAKGMELFDAPDGESLGRLRSHITVAYTAIHDEEWAHILTPCENRAWVRLDRGTKITTADVVVDAGHGGGEPGAIGPSGLTEKELNLAIARRVVDLLEAQGLKAVLTRRTDYRVTIPSRVAIAGALKPKAFISVHHNAEPDEVRAGPGSETYYQVRSTESKRLSGLLYEEIVAALAAFPAEWMADRDAGAKVRLNLEGGDYYGILRRSFAVGVDASLIESAFISNPTEEALLRRDDVREAEAQAITRALLRFLRTQEPGSGFVEAYVRHAPAGSGGGAAGCLEPS